MACDAAKRRQLIVGREHVLEAIRCTVDEVELLGREVEVAHVSFDKAKALRSVVLKRRFEAREHRRRGVDADDLQALARQMQRDATGADGQLERWQLAAVGELLVHLQVARVIAPREVVELCVGGVAVGIGGGHVETAAGAIERSNSSRMRARRSASESTSIAVMARAFAAPMTAAMPASDAAYSANWGEWLLTSVGAIAMPGWMPGMILLTLPMSVLPRPRGSSTGTSRPIARKLARKASASGMFVFIEAYWFGFQRSSSAAPVACAPASKQATTRVFSSSRYSSSSARTRKLAAEWPGTMFGAAPPSVMTP